MSLHDKHRQRLDKKVYEYGLDTLEAHEQLEYILFAVIPRGDTNKIAHRLLDRYHTLSAVLNAEPEALERIEGVGHRTAEFLTSLPSVLGIVERCTRFGSPPELFNFQNIMDFAKTFFYGKLNEAVYMFSLNSAYKLLAIHKISEGIAGEVHAFPAKLVKQALRDNASVVLIAHNHPSGNVKPSKNDVELSFNMLSAFEAVDIYLHDSVVIGGNVFFSMRENGYFDRDAKVYGDKIRVDEELINGV